MKKADLQNIWNAFANIQINKNGCTEAAFHIWKAGTSRVSIWKWFNSHLPYAIRYQEFSLMQLELLWDDLSHIVINDDDEIESDFYCWEKGTPNFEIWHWFDEKLPDGLGKGLGV